MPELPQIRRPTYPSGRVIERSFSALCLNIILNVLRFVTNGRCKNLDVRMTFMQSKLSADDAELSAASPFLDGNSSDWRDELIGYLTRCEEIRANHANSLGRFGWFSTLLGSEHPITLKARQACPATPCPAHVMSSLQRAPNRATRP